MNTISNNPANLEIALNRLKSVYDPEIGLNVVDLGLIYKIDFIDDDRMIHVLMTLTSSFCPMGESITEGVKNALVNMLDDYNVTIDLIFEPVWNSSMISEEGKLFLKY